MCDWKIRTTVLGHFGGLWYVCCPLREEELPHGGEVVTAVDLGVELVTVFRRITFWVQLPRKEYWLFDVGVCQLSDFPIAQYLNLLIFTLYPGKKRGCSSPRSSPEHIAYIASEDTEWYRKDQVLCNMIKYNVFEGYYSEAPSSMINLLSVMWTLVPWLMSHLVLFWGFINQTASLFTSEFLIKANSTHTDTF